MTEKNMEKYEIYKQLSSDLTKAMKQGFYYEAIFIEYAILEDRLASVLKYAGVLTMEKAGNQNIAKKINDIRKSKEFSSKFVRERLSFELLDSITAWKDKRNRLIHNLANIPYDAAAVREVAEEGYEIVKVVKNKSDSVINRFKKERLNNT